ncbi:hypothetical protein ACE1TI_07340 [Alteribacillus sp. JSM 102045]|uniref:hypothetical protein n=1 Tax=Alteribacillus sp. JSM 102045 TaxID=1562101 RepID=UPI0035BF876B
MKVQSHQLKEGCILDVYAVTSHPVVRKKTVLNADHLKVLEVFFIQEVSIEKTLIDSSPFYPTVQEEEEQETHTFTIDELKTFLDHYLEAVQSYKRLFQSWLVEQK